MKVAIDYRNGHYSIYDPTTRKFADGIDIHKWVEENTIEISDEDWREYQSFVEREQEIHNWIKRLSDELYIIRLHDLGVLNFGSGDAEEARRGNGAAR